MIDLFLKTTENFTRLLFKYWVTLNYTEPWPIFIAICFRSNFHFDGLLQKSYSKAVREHKNIRSRLCPSDEKYSIYAALYNPFAGLWAQRPHGSVTNSHNMLQGYIFHLRIPMRRKYFLKPQVWLEYLYLVL